MKKKTLEICPRCNSCTDCCEQGLVCCYIKKPYWIKWKEHITDKYNIFCLGFFLGYATAIVLIALVVRFGT